jgi:hypothetical protein
MIAAGVGLAGYREVAVRAVPSREGEEADRQILRRGAH